MGRLEADGMNAEAFFVEPEGHFTAQAALTLRRMKMRHAVEGVAGEGGSALAGDNKHEPRSLMALTGKEMQKFNAGSFNAFTVEIEPGIRLGLATIEFLRSAAIKGCEGWWRGSGGARDDGRVMRDVAAGFGESCFG